MKNTLELLRELNNATPFKPFTIVLVDGKTYRVTNPDCLFVSPKGTVAYESAKGPFTFLNPLVISRIESKAAPSAA